MKLRQESRNSLLGVELKWIKLCLHFFLKLSLSLFKIFDDLRSIHFWQTPSSVGPGYTKNGIILHKKEFVPNNPDFTNPERQIHLIVKQAWLSCAKLG